MTFCVISRSRSLKQSRITDENKVLKNLRE